MLKHIGFENFKCISGKEFDLSHVNVFTGYNGRGKSSVMQAILMLSQSVKKDDANSIAHLHVNGRMVNLGDLDEVMADPNLFEFGIKMVLSNTTDHKVELRYEMTDDYKVGQLCRCLIDEDNYFDTPSAMKKDVQEQKEEIKGDLKQLPMFLYNHFWSQYVHYVSADRIGPVKFVERDELPEFFTVGADGSRTINTLSAYQEKVCSQMNVSSTDTEEYDLMTAATMWLNEIMTGGSVEVSGSAIRKDADSSKKSTILKLNFGVRDEGRSYPNYNVGYGYSYVLSIIVTALIAKEGDMVIVENPEAHLHPEAQLKLTYLLAKLGGRGVQVFIETHSEHVVNGIRLAALKSDFKLSNDDVRIFFFDRDFSKIDLKIEKNGKIANWPMRFFDQYQRELSEIITLGAQQNGS